MLVQCGTVWYGTVRFVFNQHVHLPDCAGGMVLSMQMKVTFLCASQQMSVRRDTCNANMLMQA